MTPNSFSQIQSCHLGERGAERGEFNFQPGGEEHHHLRVLVHQQDCRGKRPKGAREKENDKKNPYSKVEQLEPEVVERRECRQVPETSYRTELRVTQQISYVPECQMVQQQVPKIPPFSSSTDQVCSQSSCQPSGCTDGGSICSATGDLPCFSFLYSHLPP